jgi:hypothetical protein
MAYRTATSRRARSLRRAGFTLSEYLVTMGIATILVIVVCSLSLFNGRSIAAYATYVDLDQANRNTLNQMVKDFRMGKRLTSFAANQIVLQDLHSNTVTYAYDSSAKTLTRTKDGTSKLLLKDCARLNFVMNERSLTNATLDFYTCTNITECKAITVNWCASRTYLGIKSDDMPQTLSVVMRN